MKTLVFGGSFDPPHRGHAHLLRAAAERVRPDRILVIPAYHAPLKGAPSAPAAARAELARLGIVARLPARWRRLARIDMSEARARRPVFTVETLSRLKSLDPDGDFHFVCGGDSAASFGEWRDPARLKRQATWWYGPRPGKRAAAPEHFRKLAGRFPDISSTELRSALALGEDCSDAVYPEVLAELRARQIRLAAFAAHDSSDCSIPPVHDCEPGFFTGWGGDPALPEGTGAQVFDIQQVMSRTLSMTEAINDVILDEYCTPFIY